MKVLTSLRSLPTDDWRLIIAVAEAVAEPELAEIRIALERRVLGNPHDGYALDRLNRLLDDDPEHRGLRPFVELALHDVLCAVNAPGWTAAMKRARAIAAIELAGF